MLEEELLRMLVRGTRGGKSTSKRKPRAKTMKKRSGGAKSGYMAHVKKYHKMHPNLTWKEAMVKARSSYKSKKPKRAGTMAGTRAAGSVRSTASKVNKKLKDTKAISKILRGFSAIPTPLSGYSQDAAYLASALGYGRRLR
jgi:hypothetical protein